MGNNGTRTDLLLPQNTSIPPFIEERGGTRIFLAKFGGDGRRVCCVSVAGAQVTFGPRGTVFFRGFGERYSKQIFGAGVVLAIGRLEERTIIRNNHLCLKCLRNTGRKGKYFGKSAKGTIFIFHCPYCESSWEVLFPSHNGDGRGKKNHCHRPKNSRKAIGID